MYRRDFLSSVGTGATAYAMSALSYGQVAGANNRVRVGFIGCGNRGRSVASRMKQAPDTEFVAHADVYDRNAGIAKDSEWSQPDADIYKDFRDILDRDDVDAVLIGTPDHWHAIPTVLACQAGKDVYVEKPLAHNIVEGRAMVNAARDNERIVQTGTQHRSAPHYMEVAQMVREGDLGEIRYVRVWNYRGGGGGGGRRGGRGGGGGRGGRRGGGGGGGRGGGRGRGRGVELDSNGIPVGLDWDFYVGPAPMVPFSRERWPVFRGWFDFAGGFVTDFGTHRFDSMRQLMGEADPISASASGIASDGSGGDTPAIVQATLGFPGFVMSYEAITGNSTGNGFTTPGLRNYQGGDNRRPHGIALYGTQGTIFIDRIGYDVYPAGGGGGFGRGRGRGGQESDAASEEIPVTQLGDVPDLPPESERLVRRGVQSDDRTDLHTINFIECVRSRELPNADVEIGQRSTSVGHLINIAYRSGKKFTFDPETESIPDAPEAAALLTRKAREPWDIIPGT